jgi:hypothetical protein
MKKILLFSMLSFVISIATLAQSVTIDPRNTASNIIDAKSTNQGVTVPKMTTIQKNAITNKVDGMMVYDTNIKQFSYWKEFVGMPGLGTWQDFGAPAYVETYWNPSGNDINNGNNGNVGIGTGSPMQKLDVVGSIKLTGEIKPNGTAGLLNHVLRSNGAGGMSWGAISSNGWATIDHAHDDYNFKTTFPDVLNRVVTINSPVMSKDGYSGIYKNGGFNIYNASNGIKLPFITMDGKSIQARYQDDNAVNGYEDDHESDLNLNPFGGNVGIGTVPFTKFHVKYIDPNYAGSGSGITPYGMAGFESNIDAFINLMSPSAYQSGVLFGSPLSSVRGGIIYTNNSGGNSESLALRTGGNINRMVIDKNGNVAIGDFMPQNKLDVNGVIRAKEVIVETGWADYVFDESYKLISIDDMETFIKENKHLPNVPSASEIETKGMKVGETNKAMMEKIEELALYIIQLKKEIDVLKSKN